jgi:hypothetical protein
MTTDPRVLKVLREFIDRGAADGEAASAVGCYASNGAPTAGAVAEYARLVAKALMRLAAELDKTGLAARAARRQKRG